MLFTTLIRNILFIFTVSLSIVFFVSCQREVEEILEESPEPDPDPDSSGKRLKAVYLLVVDGGQDTTEILKFKYDGNDRLFNLEQTSLSDLYYERLSFYYQGANLSPYLVIDSISEDDGYVQIDSSFIFYDPLGRITNDSTITWRNNAVSGPDLYLEEIVTQKFTYNSSSSVQVDRIVDWYDRSGGVANRREEVVNINILQNSADVFEQNYEERDVSGSGYFSEYRKIEFSQYHNPFKSLLPPYPYLLYVNFMEMEGDFPFYPSRLMQDRADVAPDNVRYFVESHIDSFPTRVRLEYYNVPGWVDTHLFEYE